MPRPFGQWQETCDSWKIAERKRSNSRRNFSRVVPVVRRPAPALSDDHARGFAAGLSSFAGNIINAGVIEARSQIACHPILLMNPPE
jgi:hypothetical protein